jgi:hypothetical protein
MALQIQVQAMEPQALATMHPVQGMEPQVLEVLDTMPQALDITLLVVVVEEAMEEAVEEAMEEAVEEEVVDKQVIFENNLFLTSWMSVDS